MTWGKLYWPYLIIVVSFMFGIPELIALFTNVKNTLSDYARYELHVGVAFQHSMPTLAWWSSLIVWATFVIWITAHIWYGKWG